MSPKSGHRIARGQRLRRAVDTVIASWPASRRAERQGRGCSSYLSEPLESRLLLSNYPLDSTIQLTNVAGDIQSTLNSAQSQLAPLLDHPLPLIGNQLGSAVNSLTSLATKLQMGLQNVTTVASMESALVSTLGPSGLGVLAVNSDGTFLPADETDNGSPTQNITHLEFDLPLTQSFTVVNTSLGFNAGLPGLGLSLSGNILLQVGYTYQLDFGYDSTLGFFINTSPNPELTLNANMTLPGGMLTGQLGPLQLTATDNGTHFNASFGVDFQDTNASQNGLLPLASIPSNLALAVILSGDSNLNLNADVSFGGDADFPSLSTNFVFDWPFSNTVIGTDDSINNFGGDPTVSFNNVSLDLGSFFSNFVSPIITKLDNIVAPLQPLIDFLNKRVPILSDVPALVSLLHGSNGTVTLLDLLQAEDPGNSALQFVSDFNNIDSFLQQFQPSSFSQQLGINLGTFGLGGPSQLDGVDPRNLSSLSSVNLMASDLTGEESLSNIENQLEAAGAKIAGDAGAKVAGFLASLASDFDGPDLGDGDGGSGTDGNLDFPILDDPQSAFNVLLGQNVDLFTFSMPTLSVDASFDQFFSILGPLGVELKGNLDANDDFFTATANLSGGYDTQGIQEFVHDGFNPNDLNDLLDGFFVNTGVDPNNPKNPPTPQIVASLGLEADAELNAVVANAGVGGGINGSLSFALNDPNTSTQFPYGQGKLRASGIATDLDGGTLFNISGLVTAFLHAFVQIGGDVPGVGFVGYEQDYDIASVTLFQYPPPPQPMLATLNGNTGVLTINIGPYSKNRMVGDLSDGNDTVTISPETVQPDGTETVSVSAFGMTQQFSGVKEIYAEGGNGNNSINILPGVTASAVIYGGFNAANPDDNGLDESGVGNDTIQAGSGATSIYGSTGADDLYAGSGNDLLEGGTGSNTFHLQAGAGTPTLYGNSSSSPPNPGDNNTLVLVGTANPGDTMTIGKNASSLVTITAPNTSILANGIAALDVEGNDDSIVLNDVTGTSLTDIGLNLGDANLPTGNPNPHAVVINAKSGASVSVVEDTTNFSNPADTTVDTGATLDVKGLGPVVDVADVQNDSVQINVSGAGPVVTAQTKTVLGSLSLTHSGTGATFNIVSDSGPTSVVESPGASGDAVFITAANAATTVTTRGINTVYIGPLLSLLVGPITITGDPAGSTAFTADDSSDSASQTGALTPSQLTGLGMIGGVAYSNLTAATIQFGSGNYVFTATGASSESLTVNAGPGNDSVNASAWETTIDVFAGNGNDTITAGDGGDLINAGNGANSISTGAGNDQIITGNGNSTINSGAGDDVINPGSGANTINGGAGNNLLVSSAGASKVLTNSSLTTTATTSFSNIGRVSLLGETANNTFNVSGWTGGPVQIDGVTGTNTLVSTDNTNFTLTDASLSRSDGAVFDLAGVGIANLTGGLANDTFDVTRWSGTGTLTGSAPVAEIISTADGNATLTNTTLARAGRGTLNLSNINAAELVAGPSNVTLDAHAFSHAVTLDGSAGNDTLMGTAFDDSIWAGTGAASIVAGGGNAIIDAVGASSAIVVGGAGHDTIYGSAGADNITVGSTGNVFFGEGGSDTITGAGSGDTIQSGTGPAGYTPPTPILDSLANLPTPGATLPTGPNSGGQWQEFGGSASAGGVSSSLGAAVDPATVVGSSGTFVAWADNRSGTYEIDVAEDTSSGWKELAGSAHGGGISNSAVDSRRPSITLDASGNPIVAWTEANNIFVADYSPSANGGNGGWVGLGTSLNSGGISSTSHADNARIVQTMAGPVVAWLDSSAGPANVYVKSFNGTAWLALATGSASGAGVSASASSVAGLSAATDGAKVAVAWTQTVGSFTQIDLLQYSGGSFGQVDGSASGGGVSNTPNTNSDQPSVAYANGSLYAAWQLSSAGVSHIAAAVAGGSTWNPLTIAIPAGINPISILGSASQPQLASGDGVVSLAWTQDELPGDAGQAVAIFAARLSGSTFVPQLPGDDTFNGIQGRSAAVGALALAVDPSGHPFVAWADTSSGSPQIYLRGDTLSVNHVYYINGNSSAAPSFTTAAGSAGNDGLTPATPVDSLAHLFSKYTLQTGDVVLVDSGTYGGSVGIPGSGGGFLIVGSDGAASDFTSVASLSGTQNVGLQQLQIDGGVAVTNATGTSLVNDVTGPVTISGGLNTQIEHSTLSGLTLASSAGNVTAENGVIASPGLAINGSSSGASGLLIRNEQITGAVLGASASGTITGNTIANPGGAALSITAPFTGSIDHNSIVASSVGVNYSASAPLTANRISGNATGVVATLSNPLTAFGFVGSPTPNQIFANTIGVNLTGQMQNQDIFANTTGVTGSGTLGPVSSLSRANVIEFNGTGVSFSGPVQFNRIDNNAVGILAGSAQLIDHNIIYNNTTAGVETSAATDVRIISNTFYNTAGYGVWVNGGSSNVQVLDDIFYADGPGAYDIFVNNDSQVGFFSNYNDLYADNSAAIVHWFQDFVDILDWQADVATYDLQSIGTTAVNPTYAQPRFADPYVGDFRVFDLLTPQRSSSPTIGAAAPFTDQGLPSSDVNLLANPSFENGVSSWSVNVGGGTQSNNPVAFDGSSYFFAGSVASGFAQQTLSLTAAGFTASQLDAQNLVVVFGGRIRSAAETVPDQGTLSLTFLDGSGNPIGTPQTLAASNVSNRWELVGGRVNIPVGARSVQYSFQNTRQTGSTDDSYLDNAFVYVLPNSAAPDQGAYGNTAAQTDRIFPHLQLQSPDLYVNWVLNQAHVIRWASDDSNGSPIQIDLYQNGVFLLNITPSAPDTGSFSWIPQNSGLSGTITGLSIRVTLVSTPSAFDQSTEPFAIVQPGTSFFVNNNSTTGDQYTTAVGSNRNTGLTPSSPLPLLTNLLRTYSLNSSDTIFIDNGTYNDFQAATFSSNSSIGTGAGATVLGPTNNGTNATIQALGVANDGVIDVNNANFVTIKNLSLTGSLYGVWVHNGSQNLILSHVAASGAAQDGIRIESDSTGASLDHITAGNNGHAGVNILGSAATLSAITADNNANDGVFVGGNFTSISASTADNNGADGFDLTNPGAASVSGSEASGNQIGINVTNNTNNTTTTLGNANLAATQGNIVHNNSIDGILAGIGVNIVGNTVYGQTATGAIGINITSLSQVNNNVVWGNQTGISAINGQVPINNNRVFDNSIVGINISQNSTTLGDVVYSNGIGIQSTDPNGATPIAQNDLIYANVSAGILILGGSEALILDNTIYELTGDAIRLATDPSSRGAANVSARDNILFTSGAFDINVSPQSEQGFNADYNLFYTSGSGQVGQWENIARANLQAWRGAAGTDANSLYAQPLFVSVNNASLGFVSGVDHGSTDDFHDQSPGGSFHGGALAPVISGTTGLPVLLTATLTDDASESPAVDRGDPAASFANEPAPNGAFINIGAYGNTTQASESPIPYVLVLVPNGGETPLAGRNFTIRWRSQDTTGNVNIDLLQGSTPQTAALVSNIATAVANNGQFVWSIPAAIASASNYYIRITRNGSPPAVAISAAAFTIEPASTSFYVNDGTVDAAGDITSAPGNDANNGLTPATPKATIQAILQAYTPGAGDTIFVDAGTYNLGGNIVIPAADSGVKIEGYANASFPTRASILNRGNTSVGSFGIDVQGAANVTLDHLSITGADVGINASASAGSTGLTISNDVISGNLDFGVELGTGNGGAAITGNQVSGQSGTGISVTGDQVSITNNQVFNNLTNGVLVQNGSNSIISGNTVYNNRDGINANNSTISGNIAYGNPDAGIMAGGNSVVSGNTTFDNVTTNGFNQTGIYLTGGSATGNVSYGNEYGIFIAGNNGISASNNLIYNNTIAGLSGGLSAQFTASANVITGNAWGIQFLSAAFPTLTNNLIYSNTAGGIDLTVGEPATVVNNTIYQPTGDGLRISAGSSQNPIAVRNNIIWTQSGFDLNVDPSAASSLVSDYNDLYVTGTGNVGLWQGAARSTLAAWQAASLNDADSLSADPLFVSVAGGDFHEQSQFGSFHGGSLAVVLNSATGLPMTVGTPSPVDDGNTSPTIDRGNPSDLFGNEPTPNGGFINLGAYGNTNQASISPAHDVLVIRPNGGETWVTQQTFTIQWRDEQIGSGTVNIDLFHKAANGTLTLETNIATAVANSGSFVWHVPSTITLASDYVIRVTDSATSDTSDNTFSIGTGVNVYYVNDGTVNPGDITTAPGNDANNGTSPATPKATIQSVLNTYSFNAGDMILVDNGSYNISSNILLKAADSGITIQGVAGGTVLNRGNTASGSADFQLDGATNLTLSGLTLTGGYDGLMSTSGTPSTHDTLQNSTVSNNTNAGIDLSFSNADNFTLNADTFVGSFYGINGTSLNGLAITNSTFSTDTDPISVNAASSSISGNTLSGNGTSGGFNAVTISNSNSSSAALDTVSNNLVHDNGDSGISSGANVLVVGNTVYNNGSTNGFGLGGGGEFRNNTVYGNFIGISLLNGQAIVDGNRVYHNTTVGIANLNSPNTITGNFVYSNGTWGITSVGVRGSLTTISNNLIYANSTGGIDITNDSSINITNNTVYQPTGTVFRTDTTANSPAAAFPIVIQDNIFYAAAGPVYVIDDYGFPGFQADYNDIDITGTATIGTVAGHAFTKNSDWIYETGNDLHSIWTDPKFILPAGADGMLGYVNGADHGADDNFHVQSTSPTIDAGNPAAEFIRESAPNGGRDNLGYDGDSSTAAPSAATTVQVVSPTSLEKLQVGTPYTIQWQTTGLLSTQTLTEVHVGGAAAGEYNAAEYQAGPLSATTTTAAINTSGVANPAPQAVYQSAATAASGVGNLLSFSIPVSDGTYTIRLDFAEPFETAAGARKFDILLQGQTVQSGFDIFAAAGNANHKAVALSFTVTASGGSGISLQLKNDTSDPAILNGFQVIAANAGGTANPTANVQVSTDNGNTWNNIATNQPLDAEGRGTFAWTPTTPSSGYSALVRVVASNAASTTGISVGPFSIAPAGTAFYVNANSAAGGSLTTAGGNNLNDGKTPATPMASIEAVLNAYHPGAGQTIFVDSGTYNLFANLLLPAAQSGLIIEGPAGATAILNRGNTAQSDFVFDFQGATNVTLDHLGITGGYIGVNAEPAVNSTGITLSNDNVFGNSNSNIATVAGDNNWLITGSSIHDAVGGIGIDLSSSSGAVITNNTIFNNPQDGIFAQGASGAASITISGNTIDANGVGVVGRTNVTISGNSVFNNSTIGIDVDNGALAVGNTVFKQSATNTEGIFVNNGGEARSNIVYANYFGILTGGNSVNTIDRNKVYSNTSIGIDAVLSPVQVIENLIYANGGAGLSLSGIPDSFATSAITGNTIDQIAADAVHISTSPGVVARNNILWTQAGDDLDLDAASQVGFVSDYNDLYITGGGQIGGVSGQDAHSISADPKFVDIDGADNVLGFNPAANNNQGYNGGLDDNFYLSAGSPAIDRGFSWAGYITDIEGVARADDPGTPNAGSNDYAPAVQGSSSFNPASGTAKNFHTSSPATFSITLPFTFSFYGTNYTTAWISSTGVIRLGSFQNPDPAASSANSDAALLTAPLIAPLWGNLITNVGSNDIFVDTTIANQVTIRWNATNASNNTAVNFDVVLFSNGQIRFDYGAGNTGLTPTVGISMGDGQHAQLVSGYDGDATLTNAASVLFSFVPGTTDIGAYEFHGNSAQATPTTITSTTPAAIAASSSTAPISQIGLTFSAAVNSVDAMATTDYQLIGAGPDGVLGTNDDLTYTLTPQYTSGSNQVTLLTGSALPPGLYRLTVFATSTGGIHDVSGFLLDGDANGTAGGNYVRTFTVANPSLNLSNNIEYLRLDADGQHVDIWNNAAATGSPAQTVLLSSLTTLVYTGPAGGDEVILDFSNGNPLPVGGISLAGGTGQNTLQFIGASGSAAVAATISIAGGSFTIPAGPSGGGAVADNLGALSIAAGSSLMLAASDALTDQTIFTVNNLSIAGTLDVTNNSLAINYAPNASPLAAIRSELVTGYNGGAWNGVGIISSFVASSGGKYFLAYVDGGVDSGTPAKPGQVLVRYSLVGDTNLDGTVNLTDLLALLNSYGEAGKDSASGDTNYDGTVNLTDLLALLNTYGQTVSNPVLLVNTLADPSTPVTGTLSLRQAIADADSAGGATIIDFATGLTGTINLASSLPAITRNITINGPGTGTLSVTAQGSGSIFTINSGVIARIDNLTIASSNAQQSGLTIVSGGTLDIANGSLALDYVGNSSPLKTIQSELVSGYAGGAWNGTGIISSSAAKKSSYAIGYADGATDSGTPAQPGQVLLKYTLIGDANLDGTVNLTDLLAMLNSYGEAGKDWAAGDFNYDGTVNLTDLLALLNTYSQTASSTSDATSSNTTNSPASTTPSTVASSPSLAAAPSLFSAVPITTDLDILGDDTFQLAGS